MSVELKDHLSQADLSEYLEKTYSIKVTAVLRLDFNVYKIELLDNHAWVVRVFQRPTNEVEADASLLRYLTEQGFPAEQCAIENAVSSLRADVTVLVTRFATGDHPERNRITFRRLGHLLGQLHNLPVPLADIAKPGGAWHHLTSSGGLEEELRAARTGLETFQTESTLETQSVVGQLISLLDSIEVPTDLPIALVHPDFVPPNVIQDASTGEWTIVDWAGVGIGLRVLSLGYLLFVAAARGKLILVDFVMSAYKEFVHLTHAELEYLKTAVWFRPFTIDCWDVFHGRKDAAAVLEASRKWISTAEDVSARVQAIMQPK